MLEGLAPLKAEKPCKLALIAETLTMEDRDILWQAVDDKTRWSPSQLSVALGHRGVHVSRYHIEKHRGRVCPC